jgi:hypothetical protein
MFSNSNVFRKTSAGNYFGYYRGYYIFTYKKAHGSWCCSIGKKGEWLWREGNFGRSLPTLKKVQSWIIKTTS